MNGNWDFGVELGIDEFVLHGFGHLERTELEAAVEQVLSRLFAQQGLPSSLSRGGRVDSLDGGTFTAQRCAGVQDIGGQIAQAIYRSFRS